MSIMGSSEIKKLISSSLDPESDPLEIFREMQDAGVDYNFREGFTDMVLDKVFASGAAIVKKVEFARDMNTVLFRLALTGAAAVVALLVSLFLMEGSFSLNSFLGLGCNYDETILSLLTGY